MVNAAVIVVAVAGLFGDQFIEPLLHSRLGEVEIAEEYKMTYFILYSQLPSSSFSRMPS